MSRSCSVCLHPARAEIDTLLIQSVSYRDIGRQFNVSKDSVFRHKVHINGTLLKARDVEEATRADSLLSQIRDLESRARGILARAEKQGDYRSAIAAIRESRTCIETLIEIGSALRSSGADAGVSFESESVNSENPLARRISEMSDAELIEWVTGGRWHLRDCEPLFPGEDGNATPRERFKVLYADPITGHIKGSRENPL
jgi:hypothetical protein